MNNEIKEILDNIKYLLDNKTKFILMTDKDTETLLDYITNLQEKYEKMKENAEILSNGYNELEKRIDKAIEFLDNEYNYKKGDAKFNRTDYVIWQSLKNILNGDNE